MQTLQVINEVINDKMMFTNEVSTVNHVSNNIIQNEYGNHIVLRIEILKYPK